MKVSKIIIPNKPHLDPIAAIYLLLEYGKEKFEGISNADISFWEHSHNPSLEDIKKFESEGTLMLDIGGGMFDHHGKNDGKETSTSLVAAHLGIGGRPELNALLSYIQEDDLEGLHNRYGELAYMIKCMHKQEAELSEVIRFTLQALHFFQATQLDWHYVVKKEFEEKCQIIRVKRNKNKVKLGIIESDNVQVANYGISVAGFSMIIQRRSTGHVMILTNKHHRINIREIVGAIRKRELEVRGNTKYIDPRKMQFEGKNTQIPFWFYHKSLNAFMNGSDAITKAEATKIPFNEIVELVHYGLSSEHSPYCDCDKSGGKCPFAQYGFSKCENRRKSAY
jgi:hypothetical protein